MSDNWFFLISEEPDYLPDERRRQEVCEKFARIAPEAENVSVRLSDRIQFFDCGSNLETILCPACEGEIGTEWWGDRMATITRRTGFGWIVTNCRVAGRLERSLNWSISGLRGSPASELRF